MIAKLLIRFVIWIAVLAAILFTAAGTVNWTAGWIYLALMLGSGLSISLWLLVSTIPACWKSGSARSGRGIRKAGTRS